MVACESVNLSDHLRPLQGSGVPIILDATANPANRDVVPDAWAIASCEPNYMPYVLASGGVPIPYTGSVACAAVSLALYWGASPVVLLGQDCAYTDGRYYAQGTPYADLTTEVVDGLVIVHGRSKEQEPLSALMCEAWGSTAEKPAQVASDHAMATFIRCLSEAADAHYIVNATQGGARIEYTYELPLATVLERFPVRERMPLQSPPQSDTATLCAELLCAATKVLVDPSITSVPHWLPLLNMYTAEMGFDHSGTPRQRIAKRRMLMELGAREIVEALT